MHGTTFTCCPPPGAKLVYPIWDASPDRTDVIIVTFLFNLENSSVQIR